MRHVFSFIVSALIHIAVVFGIVWVANAKNPAKPKPQVQAVNFEFGELIAARAIRQEPEKTVQQIIETEQIEEPIVEPEVVTEIPEPEPIVETLAKPIPMPKLKQPKPEKKVKKPKPKVVKKPKKKKVPKKKPKKKVVKKKQKKVVKKQPKKRAPKKKPQKKPVKQTQPKSTIQFDTLPPSNKASTAGNQSKSTGQKGAKNKTSGTKGNSQSIAAYRSGLQRAISRAANKNYPSSARRRNKQGTVSVKFNLASNGRISSVVLVGSSGNSALDKAAIKALRRMGKYKSPPAGFPSTLTVPIRFRLR